MPTENEAATRAERPTQALNSESLNRSVQYRVTSCQYVCWDCLDKLWYRGLQRLKPLFWGIERQTQLPVDVPVYRGNPSESINWMVLHTGHKIERLE